MDLDKLVGHLERDPSDIYRQAISLGKAQQYEQAIRLYDLCLSLNPWNVDVLNNKADCLLALGHLEEARDIVTRALMVDPTYALAWCTLAEIQVKCEEFFCSQLNFHVALSLSNPEEESYQATQALLRQLSETNRTPLA